MSYIKILNFDKVDLNCFLLFLDIDECIIFERNECDVNVLCINIEGFYVCWCVRGYVGDGINCLGIVIYLKSICIWIYKGVGMVYERGIVGN